VFGIIQKKGNENKLCGKVIGYVKIPRPEPGSGEESPFDALVSPDGILAIQGDYSKHQDFESFRNNLQQSLPKSLQEFLKTILDDDEIRESLDRAKKISVNIVPQKGRIGDFFPVPAQFIPFQSEEILLNEDCDIYFLGDFSSISSAHLFLTGFPILYQSKYREQIELENEKEVDNLLAEIDGENPAVENTELEQNLAVNLSGDLNSYKGNLLELFSVQILPKMMYAIEESDHEIFIANITTVRRFMRPYLHQQDIEEMISILQSINERKHSTKNDAQSLALLCKKISALHHEEFEALPEIQKKLEELRMES